MTRGRYAKKAAVRRAASAEDQNDRLIEQVVHWKTLAKRNQAEADRAISLARTVRELRETVGMPVADHERIVAELETAHAKEIAHLTENVVKVLDGIGLLMKGLVDERRAAYSKDTGVLSPRIIGGLLELPEACGDAYLEALQWDREARRQTLNKGLSNKVSEHGKRRALQLALLAEANGGEHGTIPAWMIERDDPL